MTLGGIGLETQEQLTVDETQRLYQAVLATNPAAQELLRKKEPEMMDLDSFKRQIQTGEI